MLCSPAVIPRSLVSVCRPSRSSPSSTVKNGDILLVNKCSYIDVLFLMAAYAAPTFTVTTQEGGLEEVSFLQALKASVLGVPQRWKQLPSGGKAGFTTAEESVDTIVRRNLSSGFRGPLVVFPEGAPTNNKAVLMFTPLIDQLERCVVTIARGHGDAAKLKVPTVHILALRYSNGSAGFLPCFTGGGRPLLHAYFVCAQGSNSLHVSRLPDNYEPQPADFINAASSASSSSSSAAGGAGGSSSSATGVAVANTGSDLQARKAAGISEGASTDDASAAAGGGGVSAATSWPFAVRDALTQLVGRGSKAVALGASHYDEYLALVEENNRIQQGQEQGGSKSGGSKRR